MLICQLHAFSIEGRVFFLTLDQAELLLSLPVCLLLELDDIMDERKAFSGRCGGGYLHSLV